MSQYQHYVGDIYASFDSRKNFLFMFMLFVFISARPALDKHYDHWLKFFAFNMALTFPLSLFMIGFRVSDVCTISAIPLLAHCAGSRCFSASLKISVILSFIVSMFIFSLRMTRVY